jgi:hypothetical protein
MSAVDAWVRLNDATRVTRGVAGIPVPVSARVDTGSETVGRHNVRHMGKAWAIVAMAWEGCAYCADCAYGWPTFEDVYDRGDECPMPVFQSDERYGDPCDGCGNII